MTKLDFRFGSNSAEVDEAKERAAAATERVLEYMVINDSGEIAMNESDMA